MTLRYAPLVAVRSVVAAGAAVAALLCVLPSLRAHNPSPSHTRSRGIEPVVSLVVFGAYNM